MYPLRPALHHPGNRRRPEPKKPKTNAESPCRVSIGQILVKTWPVFFHKESSLSLAFLAALIVFRFFLTNIDLSAVLPGICSGGSDRLDRGISHLGLPDLVLPGNHRRTPSPMGTILPARYRHGFRIHLEHASRPCISSSSPPFLRNFRFVLPSRWLQKVQIGPPWLWHVLIWRVCPVPDDAVDLCSAARKCD